MTLTTTPHSRLSHALVPLGALYGALCLAHADALRTAGLNGKAPGGAGALKRFVDLLTANALWAIGTVAVLAILLIGGLFFFGHSRAGDYAAKIAVGAVIVVSAPGLAA
jgi:hypothetical protein